MFKKVQFVFGILLVLSMLLTACGPTATEAPAAEEPTAEAPAAEETAVEEPTQEAATMPEVSDLVLLVTPGGQSLTTFTKNFNPFTGSPLFPTLSGMYEPMMIYNKITGEIVPWLATGYEWSEDNLNLTFTLRDGVSWSDGEPLTTDDVVFTFNTLKNVAEASGPAKAIVGENGYISEVTADGNTVSFTFNQVFIPAFYDIILQVIVPAHIWSGVEDIATFTNDTPVATGPFTEVVDFKDQVYEVDRNPNYWQEGKPYFKGLRMPAFSGNDAAANMFVNGDTEIGGQFIANREDTVLSKNENVNCWWPTVTFQVLFITNTTKAPFDDPIMRKSIGMAFDRVKLIDIALQGGSVPTDLTGMNDAYAKYKVTDLSILGDNWVTYDPDTANQWLDEAGYAIGTDGYRTNKDGSPMELEMIEVNGFTDWLAVAPLMKQELEAIGLNVVMNTYDAAVAFDKWFKGDFDMSLSFGNLGTPTLYAWMSNAMSESTVKPVGEATTFGVNPWRFSDPAAEPWLEVLATNPDEEAQLEAAVELQKLFAQDAPFIPMWSQPTFLCYSTARFTGFPSADNPYVATSPGVSNQPETLILLTTIHAK
jgi:peptide/nickel transport system substrate-binding protein